MRVEKKTDMSKKIRRQIIMTPLLQAELDYAFAVIRNYHILCHMRMSYFEPDGSVLTSDTDGTKYRRSGRQHITRMINLFKSKDDPQYYRMCARCKELLDEYDATFAEKEKAPD